jgi:hypothetical protein
MNPSDGGGRARKARMQVSVSNLKGKPLDL